MGFSNIFVSKYLFSTPNPDDPDFLMIYQGGGSQSGSVSPQRPTLGTNIGGQSGRGATVVRLLY